jgi:hypothetical protein
MENQSKRVEKGVFLPLFEALRLEDGFLGLQDWVFGQNGGF